MDSNATRRELERIKTILRSNPRGMSISELAGELGLNRNSVAKYLNMLLVAGHVEMRSYAAAKVYFLSQRVPISAMLDFSSDLILVLDRDQRITRVNDRFIEFADVDRTEIIGETLPTSDLPIVTDPTLLPLITEAMQGHEQTHVLTWRKGEGEHIFYARLVPTVFDEGDPGLTILLEDITEAVAARKALERGEARYRAIVEDQTEFITRFAPDMTLTFANEAYCRFMGRTLSDLRGREFNPPTFAPGGEEVNLLEQIRRIAQDKPLATWESHAITPSGEECWHQWIARGIFDAGGNHIENQAVGRDITNLKQAERTLKASLQEKEILLQEIHLRVNNSLQLISSLLNLQALSTGNGDTYRTIQDIQSRIHSISLVYETLYQSRSLARINLGEYLQRLTEDLFRMHRESEEGTHCTVTAGTVTLETDQAIPCGLIVNELILNALKHAFPGERSGEIRITAEQRAGQYTLKVADNGTGIPEDVDIHTTESLGLSLVRTLATRQLNGSVAVEQTGGTTVIITFPQTAPTGSAA
ncbi:sensor histidine kinase [Methanoculleus taiwanensis]|uniref:sensor histidine kinase n=1 Tax=Methanoculleus taiwanensis TaxID=1550565 RepID=UPI000FFE6D60|nr:histidine kinase dimerization/phosphoacceptor domain -containing protein [Methanoculleus taiwanensis]